MCLLTAHWNLCFGSERGWRMGHSPMSWEFSGSGPRCHLLYHLYKSGNLESGLLFQGDLIALWHSPGTFKLFKSCLICAVMLLETLTGSGKWMTVESVFVFKHLIACMQRPAPSANRSTALMLSPFQQVHGMKGAWQLSGEESPAAVELPTMSRTLLAGRMQPEIRSVCVFLPTREQLNLAVGVSGREVAASRPLFSVVSSHCSPKSLVQVCWPKGY